MKKTKALIAKLLEEIEKTGTVQIACEKNGISRNTFYRWMNEDKEFLEQARHSIALGVGFVNDFAIGNLLNAIKSKDMKATMFWLNHRHPEFRRPYVHKVDADDIIAHTRAIAELTKKVELEREKDHLWRTMDEEAQREGMESAQAFMNKWKKVNDNARHKEALKEFEKWKEEYLKTGKEPPETI